jgi:hypothetical protein
MAVMSKPEPKSVNRFTRNSFLLLFAQRAHDIKIAPMIVDITITTRSA